MVEAIELADLGAEGGVGAVEGGGAVRQSWVRCCMQRLVAALGMLDCASLSSSSINKLTQPY